jgi:nucleoside-diphosphate-sugar epimerase
MIKLLITGGAGFIPGSLADRFAADSNYEIVLLDNLLTGSLLNIPVKDNVTFIRGDVNDFNTVNSIMCATKFDYVFHYAAVVGVRRTLDNPSWVLKDIDGFKNILDCSKNTGVKRVFFSSSSEVYGEPVEIPQHEERTPLNSRLPYAVVKNIGECFLKSYKQEFNLDYTIFRFFNTYGPKQSHDFVISKFLNLARKNEDITLYGDGLQTRTFFYIDDNTEFTKKILEKDLFINDIVNVGHDFQYTVKELAELIIELTGSSSKIVYLPALEDGDMTRRQPDVSKMRSILNRELVSLKEGLIKIIQVSK